MTTPPNRRSRWVRGGLVSLIGIGALALPAADYSTHVADPWWGPESLAGHITVLVLSALLIAGGVWLTQRDWDREYLTHVVVRTYAFTAIVAVLFVWAIALQLWTVGDPEPYVIAIDGILITAVVAFTTSVVTTERERRSDEQLRNEAEYRALAEEVIDHTDVATLVTNADGEIAWLNQAAADYFGVERAATVGRKRDTVVAATLEDCSAPTSSLASGDDQEVSHCHVPPIDGREERWLEHRSHSIEDGLHEGGRIEQYTDVTAEQQAMQALSERDQGVEALCAAATTTDQTHKETVAALLTAGRELVDAEYAAFTRRNENGQYELRASQGGDGGLPDGQVRCREAVEQAGGVVTGSGPFEEALGGFQFDHAATDGGVSTAGYQRYLGAPVRISGEHVGTVCFLARDSGPFGNWEQLTAELLAQLLAYELLWEGKVAGAGAASDTDERAYEQAIQQERERLEFINRFVRHNLLNGLNLVNARVENLENTVDKNPDAEAHLDVIRCRVEEMSALVDTIRTFMNTVIDDSGALEPVAVGPQLVEVIEAAAARYNASFTAHDLPDPDQQVVANDLVGELFDHVLANAVEHNDATDPAVEVWTTESVERLPLSTDEGVDSEVTVRAEAEDELSFETTEQAEQRALTVHIADNGPGIDAETRQRMLSGSDAALDDPGHGFGFYLVRETMARYGGGVRVRENEPRGTVIDLVFPLAA